MNTYNSEPEDEIDSITLALKTCQESNSLKSCMPCESFLGCNLRKQYVLSVYNSMNKGNTGGFEF